MAKPLVNKKKWTTNDYRLLVVLLLTVVYPALASAFFALYFFVVLPLLTLLNAAYIYWLTAALLWVVLCAVILPCFRDTKLASQAAGIDIQEGPVYPTKAHAIQPFVKVEEANEKQRNSILTNRSRSSSESIEKGVCEEKADQESLEKSKEDLGKSNASLDKGKITQSGEFLNECIDSLGSENLQEKEAECVVHVEQKNKDDEQDKGHDTSDEQDKQDKIPQEDNIEKRKLDEEPSEAVEPVTESSEIIQKEALPLEVEEGEMLENAIPEDEEMVEMVEDKEPVMRRKALPSIDTSRASGYYECSMPTPKSAGSGRPESNMVFLFVNPDIAANEGDIIVNQQGEVQEQEDNKEQEQKGEN